MSLQLSPDNVMAAGRSASAGISVVIPVYNAPDRVDDLLESLLSASTIVSEILIGDDCSDHHTADMLLKYQGKSPLIKVFRHASNLGYLGNVNELYEKASGDITVLLNSDTLVPSGWDLRIRACFDADPMVALATPLSTNANYVVLHPSFGQSWVDLDLARQAISPRYFDLPGAVGFCLAIRRSSVKRRPLLDLSYHRGYWEDTELHYHVKSLGHRSVCIDNLVVYHANGSSSFSIGHDLEQINDTNRALFMQKYGKQYIAALDDFERHNPMVPLRHPSDIRSVEQLIDDVEILFVLPAFKRGIGGIHVVLRLIELMQRRGVRASLYVYGEIEWDYVSFLGFLCPFLTVEQIRETTPHIRKVVATSHDSFVIAERISKDYGAKLVYFVQGPEAAFGNGAGLENVMRDYPRADQIITVSPFLQRYVKDISGVDAAVIRMGPNQNIFYPRGGTQRTRRTIAACVRLDTMKGTGHMLYNAVLAARAGFDVHFFGQPLPNNLKNFGIHHGELTHRNIAKLLSSVEFYLDCSLMEGLGLLPLEAAFCGAIPVVLRKHGLDHVLVDRVNCFVLPREFDNADFFAELYDMDDGEASAHATSLRSVRDGAYKLRYAVNEELGYSDFIKQGGTAERWDRRGSLPPVRIWPTSNLGPSSEASRAEELRQHVQAILSSRSWRLSRPMRAIGAVVRGRRYQEPTVPGDTEACQRMLIDLLSSSSWAFTLPVRKLGNVLRRIR